MMVDSGARFIRYRWRAGRGSQGGGQRSALNRGVVVRGGVLQTTNPRPHLTP
jgi:hypothetical protein